jgi:hypothetical protein
LSHFKLKEYFNSNKRQPNNPTGVESSSPKTATAFYKEPHSRMIKKVDQNSLQRQEGVFSLNSTKECTKSNANAHLSQSAVAALRPKLNYKEI